MPRDSKFEPTHNLNHNFLKVTIYPFLQQHSEYGLIAAIHEDGRLALMPNVQRFDYTNYEKGSYGSTRLPDHLSAYKNAIEWQAPCHGGFNPFQGWSMCYITSRKTSYNGPRQRQVIVSCAPNYRDREKYSDLPKQTIAEPSYEHQKILQKAIDEYSNVHSLNYSIKTIQDLASKDEAGQAAYFEKEYDRGTLKYAMSDQWTRDMNEAIDYVTETIPEAQSLKHLIIEFKRYVKTNEYEAQQQHINEFLERQRKLQSYASESFQAPKEIYTPLHTFASWLKSQRAHPIPQPSAPPLEDKSLPTPVVVVHVNSSINPIADDAPPAYSPADSSLAVLPSSESKKIDEFIKDIEEDPNLSSTDASAKCIKLSSANSKEKERMVPKIAYKIHSAFLKNRGYYLTDAQEARRLLQEFRGRALQACEAKANEALTAQQVTFFRKVAGLSALSTRSPEAELIIKFKAMIIDKPELSSENATAVITLLDGTKRNLSDRLFALYYQITEVEANAENAKGVFASIKEKVNELLLEDEIPDAEGELYRKMGREIKKLEIALKQQENSEASSCTLNS